MFIIKIITIEDEYYPDQLKRIKNPPRQLYVLGNEKLLSGPNFAIIGSRNSTNYGEKQAMRFAKELSLGSFNIVSGMAKGIDSVAHRGCMSVGGNTIAVLGSGFNNIYPAINIPLFHEILEKGGVVITEYPPNVRASYQNFPARNRIVSGLCKGVLVIEAAYRSGTSITAKCAETQRRDVFCIPSSVDSNKGVGTARLIVKGAKLILKPSDILKKYNMNIENGGAESIEYNIPEIYKETYNCIENNICNVDEIARCLKRPVQEINEELFMLELEGLIEKKPGGDYVPKT